MKPLPTMISLFHSLLLDEDKSHVPDVEDQDGLIGLLLFCSILEISYVLHPGTYETQDKITEHEKMILKDARKHARLLISWIKSSYVIHDSSSLTDVDLCDTLLWRISMTLSSAMADQDDVSPILPECTPDAVACALYDTLLDRKGTKYWKGRKDYICKSYDWEGILIISRRDEDLPLDTSITGATGGDRSVLPPSLNANITMSSWLQRQDEGEKTLFILHIISLKF